MVVLLGSMRRVVIQCLVTSLMYIHTKRSLLHLDEGVKDRIFSHMDLSRDSGL